MNWRTVTVKISALLTNQPTNKDANLDRILVESMLVDPEFLQKYRYF